MLDNKYVAIPPGATIKEQLITKQMQQKEFALRMNLSEKHISRLINGKVELTKEIAIRLENVLGVPANFWNNLEMIYRENLSRVNEEISLKKDCEVFKLFPYNELVNLNYIKKENDIIKKIKNLRVFFEVNNLDIVSNLNFQGISYRIKGDTEKSKLARLALIQIAKKEARKKDVSEININKLKMSIQEIRSLTNLEPNGFCQKLDTILSNCGIKIIYLQDIKGSYFQGATFLDGNHIVLALTVRGKYADIFWFSLFHELFHIIDGHYKLNEITKEHESMADEFARNTLIDPVMYERFINADNFSKESIKLFSEKIKIAPFIIIGRLQKDNYIPYSWFQELKPKYKIE